MKPSQISSELPATEIPAPVMARLPPHQPITEPVEAPDPSDKVAWGGYMATLTNCVECHTPLSPQGAPMMDLAFSGGRILEGPWGRVASHNITTDPSGIPHYDRDLFFKVMRTGHAGARKLNDVMLWGYYKGLTDEDLDAIWEWIQTLPPVQHRVDNTEPETTCRLCGQSHGLGEMN